MPQDTSPYTGKEPFIFISYAHRDDKRVLPVIHKLLAAGFRIWYDDAIEKGREWDNDIARHVRDCAVFIPFFTENYLDSFNCKNELRYALSKKRRCLAVFLEEISFEDDPGLEMYIYVNQNIMAQSMKTDTIFQKIAEVPLLQPCLIQPEPEPAPQSQAETASPAPVQPEMPRETPAEKAPAPTMPVLHVKPATPAPKFGPIRWIIWILLLLVTLIFILYESDDEYYLRLFGRANNWVGLICEYLIVGLTGMAAIAVTEVRHRMKREKNSPGLILRGCVTCLNLMLAVMLLTNSESTRWQIIAGALAAAGFFAAGKLLIPSLRQFAETSGIGFAYAAVWLFANCCLFLTFDDHGSYKERYALAGAVQFAAIISFLVMTLIFEIKAFREKTNRRGRDIVRFVVLGLLIVLSLLLEYGVVWWCVDWY